ncbi:MAG: flagellar hook-basal body complex protein [Thermoguttaceae bacterium]
MGIGLNSAIHVAGMGMGAAEKTIGVIGHNLANANTIGYKSQRADFNTVLAYTYTYGSGEGQTSPTNGGTNPIQIGMGVQLAATTTNFSQGAIKDGMGITDMAIAGNGFFVVSTAANARPEAILYTRNGAMKLDGTNTLVTNTGEYLLGYGVNDKFQIQTTKLTPLTIPIGQLNIAEATTTTTLEGTLNAIQTVEPQGTVLKTPPMTNLAVSSPGDVALSSSLVARPQVEGLTDLKAVATGNMDAGDYIYRMAYVDAAGVESDFSSPINIALSATGGVAITDLPPAIAGYTQLRIYRADKPSDVSVSPVFHEVTTVAAGTNSYNDTASSASIAGNPTLNTNRLDGSYQYYVTYADANGNESRPSLLSVVQNVNGGQLLLTNIPAVDPQSNPDNWTTRRIYRSTGTDATTFYHVGDVAGMDPQSTFIDRTSDSQLVTHQEISLAGRGNALATSETKMTDVGKYVGNGIFTPLFTQGTLEFSPRKGDTNLAAQKLAITDKTVMGDYLKFLDESLGIRSQTPGSGLPSDQGTVGRTIRNGNPGATIVDGSLVILGNSGEKNAIEIRSGDMTITNQNHRTTVDAGLVSIQTAEGVSTTSDMLVFDSLGAPVKVRLTLVLESTSNTETVYRWFADSPDNQPQTGNTIAVGSGRLVFDQHGKLVDAGNPEVSVDRTLIASVSPTEFKFQMELGGVAALATNKPAIAQTHRDGAPAGTLYDFSIGRDGVITGIFSSGVSRPLGQLVLANFANPEGLFQTGDSLYQVGSNSGQPRYGTPDTTGYGDIRWKSVEASNTDLGRELIDMISASAMYRANTKVLSSSTQMFDELIRMVS